MQKLLNTKEINLPKKSSLDCLSIAFQTFILIIDTMIESLLIGGIAGWLTGRFTKGQGFGIIANILLGIVGGMFGGWLFGALGLGSGDGFIGQLIVATIGAVILVWAYKKFVK